MILRPMAHADIAAGLRLCRAAQWNQLEDDWRCFLELKGSGCMLAERDGSVIGTAAFLRYGSSFSWISMMLVDPSERGAGIGSRLLESALDALSPQSCVRLDATPLGQPLYCRHGFVPEYELDRAKVTVAAERFHPLPGAARPMEPEDLHRVLEFDRQVFGADRRELLVSLYRRAPKFAWVAGQGSLLAGYSFGRPGYLYNQFGPIIAESAGIARELVSHCFFRHDGVSFAIDVPEAAREWVPWMESVGFEVERPFLRMSRGEIRSHGLPERQFGIAGPEFG